MQNENLAIQPNPNYQIGNTRPVKWKDKIIPDYFITDTGIMLHNNRVCSSWIVNGRNYYNIKIDDKYYSYRADYMVAYTFKGYPPDVLRLVHLDENNLNDSLDNLMWVREIDVRRENLSIMKNAKESELEYEEEWRYCNTEYNSSLNYEVSNFGLIRKADTKELVPLRDSFGYKVFYYLDDTQSKETRIKSVHRAVAEAFIPNPKCKPEVNHIDGNKSNNFVGNLEWVTKSENMQHAYDTGLTSKGNGYTIKQVLLVCQLLSQSNMSQNEIAVLSGVDRKTVSDIYRGRRWSDVSSKFKLRQRKWTPEVKQNISDLIVSGLKGKEIADKLGLDYDQSFISLYERFRRKLKYQNKI